MRGLVVGLTLLLGAAGPALAQSPAVETSGPGCRTISHESNIYAVCEIDLRRHTLKLYWKQANGAPYGSLINLAARTRLREGRVLFVTNAGMYHRDRTPVGLYVENGRELAAVNTETGAGNFFMKPNGVFFVTGNEAGLMETGRFVQQRLQPTLATQSGPMLVIDGALHPRISQHGASKNVRNGVGVIDRHRVVFAISLTRVSFGEFARLFRDRLNCANALYLDGRISGLYAPRSVRKNIVTPMGPIFAAFDRK